MLNLLEYSVNYSMASGNLQNYYRDELNDDANKMMLLITEQKITRQQQVSFFEYKTNMIGSTPANINRLDTGVVVPLKCVSNFFRCFDLSLMPWSQIFVIPEILRTLEVAGANPVDTTQTRGVTF